MSEDQPSEPPKKRKCDKCNRKINTSRFEIHYAKCQPKKKGKAAKQQVEAILKSEIGEKVEVKKREEEVADTFPCYLCGFEMKITELDSHPLRCTNREVSCWFCYVKFPSSIMANHEEVCPRKLRMEAEHRANAPVAVVAPPPKPPVVIEAPVVPPKPAEKVVIPSKPVENHLLIPPKPAVSLYQNPPKPVQSVFSNPPKPVESLFSNPPKPVESLFSNPPKPVESVFSNPPRPVEAVSIPPKPSEIIIPYPPKPVEPAHFPLKQPQIKPAPVKPLENPSAPPKTVSIPNKPPFNPHYSLPKQSAPQKPINRPPISTAVRNNESKPHKSVPKSQARPNGEHKNHVAPNHKDKVPQMKVEKDVKSQISQKENIVRPVEVKANIEKASTTQSSALVSNSNINTSSVTSINTNTIKSTNTSTNPNPNPNVASSADSTIRANNTHSSIASSNISSASTNSLSSASEAALELPRRMGEANRIMRQQEAVNRQIQRIQARINRLIQENANRRKTSKQAGLHSSLIELIPEKKYVFNLDDLECSICCIEFQPNDKLKDLRCRHNYHSKCISQWLKINRSCPLCKTDLSCNIPDFIQEKPVPPSKQAFASFINA